MGTVSTRPLPARPAPECSTESKSDAWDVYTNMGGAISANLNLCAISGKPPWAPQKTTLWVGSTPAAIVLVDEDGVSNTVTVGTGPIVITRPIKQVTDSGTGDVNVIFEWWDPHGVPERNP